MAHQETDEQRNEASISRAHFMQRVSAAGGTAGFHEDLSPELEQQFLQWVQDYEIRISDQKMITVLEKIALTESLPPVAEIADENIDEHWIRLYERLQEKGIDLQVVSPNINARELYRFVTEELFTVEVDDIDDPGLMQMFIYDDFHPDIKYDNERTAVDDCIKCIIGKTDPDPAFFTDSVRLNGESGLTDTALVQRIQLHKAKYHHPENIHIKVLDSDLSDKTCTVSGTWQFSFGVKGAQVTKAGSWSVQFEQEPLMGLWLINAISMEGFFE